MLTQGVPVTLFAERAGVPISVIEQPLRIAEERELITWNITTLCPTPLGQRFLNDVVALFLPEN